MKFILLCLALLATLLTGCASTYGTKVETSDISFIQKGKTTKAELIARLNEPSSTMKESGGKETLTWDYTKAQSDAVSYVPVAGVFLGKQRVEQRSLVVFLDKKGIVRDYSMGDDNRTTRMLDNSRVEAK